MGSFDGLPANLREKASYFEGDLAWEAADALLVIEWLTSQGLGIMGMVIPSTPARTNEPNVEFPWGHTKRRAQEPWITFVGRNNNDAARWVREFSSSDPDETIDPNHAFFWVRAGDEEEWQSVFKVRHEIRLELLMDEAGRMSRIPGSPGVELRTLMKIGEDYLDCAVLIQPPAAGEPTERREATVAFLSPLLAERLLRRGLPITLGFPKPFARGFMKSEPSG